MVSDMMDSCTSRLRWAGRDVDAWMKKREEGPLKDISTDRQQEKHQKPMKESVSMTRQEQKEIKSRC